MALLGKNKKGFTMIELLVTIAIIGILAAIVSLGLFSARASARDVRRKAEISQIGRILTLGCYLPDAGPGDYDLYDVLTELKAKNPRVAEFIPKIPSDPARGTATRSFYGYVVNDSKKCAVYANLETSGERVTLMGLSDPTPGGGTGVLEGSTMGANGTTKYFQISN